MSDWIRITVQPTVDVSHHVTSVELDGRRYLFRFYTNKTARAWFWDLGDHARGLRLTTGVDLLYPYRYLGVEACPPGILWVADLEGLGRAPDLTSFAEKRHALLYAPESSL